MKFLPRLGYDLKIACDKFQENWFIIDGEIDEKHALQNYQNKCGPGYSPTTYDYECQRRGDRPTASYTDTINVK